MLIVFFRAILLYVLIIFSIRFMGKRQIGELQPSELVVTILISNLAVLPIEDTNISLLAGAVPILVIVCMEIIISCISLKLPKLRKLTSGSPVVIIEKGNILQKELKSLRFSVDDLMEGLRTKDIFDISEVYYAIVETNGTISVLKKGKDKNTTAKMLKIEEEDTSPPITVISDGEIVTTNLNQNNIELNTIKKSLKSNELAVSDVFLMTIDDKNKTNIIKKEADKKK